MSQGSNGVGEKGEKGGGSTYRHCLWMAQVGFYHYYVCLGIGQCYENSLRLKGFLR